MMVLDLDGLREPASYIFEAHVSAALYAKVQRDEVALREMLGNWVSESEPSLAVRSDTGEILGLVRADDPSGSIIVRPVDVDEVLG